MNIENAMDCASRIKLERQKRSWTQEQLAERARISTRTVQRIECGAEASAETLRLIAEAFGLPAESLQTVAVRTHFGAPWCRTVKIVTALVVGLAVALPFVVTSVIAHAVMWGVVLFGLVFSVKGFSVRNGRLLIHRLGWATKFDLAQLSGFEVNPHAMIGSVRLFGNGGVFCFLGCFRNAVIGRYRAYVTDPAKSVVLAFGDRKIVVSPDDPMAFAATLRDMTKGVCKEAGELTVPEATGRASRPSGGSSAFTTFTLVFACLLPGPPAIAQSADLAEQTARTLLDHLDARNYAAAEAMFTVEMAASVPAAKLQRVWESLPAQMGAAKERRGPTKSMPQQGNRVVIVPLDYANGGLLAQITVTPEGRVAGFLIRPAPPPAAPSPAASPPAADAGFVERNFAVSTARGELPGTLALPRDGGPFPAVVLVHGSGPHDRDETIGPNRPFLDIARGLAAQGIAVLRYEKRTKVRPQDFVAGDYTMDDETTDDAVAAVAALAAAPDIDGKRLFVFGHSQGGMLAPRIAVRSGQVAGLVLLAAPARSLLDLLPEQNRHLLGLDGDISPKDQGHLDDLQRKIAAVRGTGEVAATDAPLGLPTHYWRAFDRIDPVADAMTLTLPLLLLQGGRDIQVTDLDWQMWRKAFAGNPRADLRHYPALSHLAIAGEGPGTPADYRKAGHVDAQLIADVATWIRLRASDAIMGQPAPSTLDITRESARHTLSP